MLLETLAERYRLRVRQHGDFTARLVLVLLEAVTGRLFVPTAVPKLLSANRQAENLARLYLTTARHLFQLPAVALPVVIQDDTERIAQALRTAQGKGAGSIERLARSEPLQSAQKALSRGLEATDQRWTRHTGPSACPDCRRLADGQPLPASVAMAIPHPSCSCVQRFIPEETR